MWSNLIEGVVFMSKYYDVEFQLKDKDVWIRVNDNIANSNEDAIVLAISKLKNIMNIDVNKHNYSVDVVNEENHD